MPESERVEEAGEDVKHELADEVIRASPVSCEVAVGSRIYLRSQRHGVFALVLEVVGDCGIASFLDDSLDLLGAGLLLFRISPGIAPILAIVVGIAAANRLKHILRRVLLRRALLSTVTFKVV